MEKGGYPLNSSVIELTEIITTLQPLPPQMVSCFIAGLDRQDCSVMTWKVIRFGSVTLIKIGASLGEGDVRRFCIRTNWLFSGTIADSRPYRF